MFPPPRCAIVVQVKLQQEGSRFLPRPSHHPVIMLAVSDILGIICCSFCFQLIPSHDMLPKCLWIIYLHWVKNSPIQGEMAW